MNKTKRKIFETASKLFAEKGYSETSIEEITAVTGIAKGTLYYHFDKKEDIFNFLIDEGMKLLKNSIEIKTSKQESATDKIKSILLIQIKVIVKYENLITLVLSQLWGKEERNMNCQNRVFEYINIIKKVVEEGIEKKEFMPGNADVIASGIFGVVCNGLIYKLKTNGEVNIQETFLQFIQPIIRGIEYKEEKKDL